MGVVSFTHRPLYTQVKRPWYPLDRRLGGTHNRSGPNGEEKNSQLLQDIEPPIIQPVVQRYTVELRSNPKDIIRSAYMQNTLVASPLRQPAGYEFRSQTAPSFELYTEPEVSGIKERNR
jgi:hypothetical protein